jgi:deazaflavin-dependent oxidoreductase (nitroreductase family)
MKLAAIVVGAAVLVLGGAVCAFFLGLRARSRAMRRFGRWFTRSIVNRYQLRSAGGVGAYASVIHHRGRRSGRELATPVQAVPVEDGFVIALPYGAGTNWVQNVLAAETATLVNEGREHRVGRPELVPLEAVADRFPPADARLHRLFRTDEGLRLRRLGSVDDPRAPGAADVPGSASRAASA